MTPSLNHGRHHFAIKQITNRQSQSTAGIYQIPIFKIRPEPDLHHQIWPGPANVQISEKITAFTYLYQTQVTEH